MKIIYFVISFVFLQMTSFAQVTLNLKLFLEGYYYSGNGLMDNFGAGGCLYIANISPDLNDVDTLTISLIEPQHLSVIDIEKGILKTDGTIAINFPNANIGSTYFIRAQHRNAIETWSATSISMQAVTNYDFTTSDSQAFGSNMVNVGTVAQPVWAFYSGDITDPSPGHGLCNQDGVVDSNDYSEIENAVMAILVGYNCQDLTGDGIVEPADYLIMENNIALVVTVKRPVVNAIEKINSNVKPTNIIKCISVNGKLLLDSHGTFPENVKCRIYSTEGKLIRQTTFGEIAFEAGTVTDLLNGFYIIRIENK